MTGKYVLEVKTDDGTWVPIKSCTFLNESTDAQSEPMNSPNEASRDGAEPNR